MKQQFSQPDKMADSAVFDRRSVPAMLRGWGDSRGRRWNRFAANYQFREMSLQKLEEKYRQQEHARLVRHYFLLRWSKRLMLFFLGVLFGVLFLRFL